MHHPSRSVRFGPFQLDLRSGELSKGATKLKVPDQSIEILKALLEQPGELMTREQLRERLWPADTFVDFEHGLNTAVRRLRAALGDVADAPRYIETLPRRGYRFVGTLDYAGCDEPVPPGTSSKGGHPPAGSDPRHGYRFTADVQPVIPQDAPAHQHGGQEGPGSPIVLLDAGSRPALGAVGRRSPWRAARVHGAWRRAASVLLLCAASAAVAALLARQPAPLVGPPVRFDVPVSPTMRFERIDGPEISPDGRALVYAAVESGNRRLFRIDLASQETIGLSGTEGATLPFWSPDSQSIGFFANGELKGISAAGGRARTWTSTEAAATGGGTWGPGTILFAPSQLGLVHRIISPGGQSEPLALPPGAYLTPHLLPDGRSFLVWERTRQTLYAASFGRPDTLRTIGSGTMWGARYKAGHLVFRQGTTLMARPFDARRQAFSGPPRQLAENAIWHSVSHTGTIVYRSARPRPRRLTWFDRNGNRIGTVGDAGAIQGMALAPSGRRAAIWLDTGGNTDIWSVDLASGITSRLTSDAAQETDAAWSPDERTLAFSSTRDGRSAVHVKHLADGKEELIADHPLLVVDTWTPDGEFIVARTLGRAVYLVPVTGDRTPRLLVETPYIEDELRISPDGRWVAFNSDESGRWEVYVAAFPDFTSKRQVSAAGGVQPHWRGDGRELFFLGPDGSMMSAGVVAGAELVTAVPSVMFSTNLDATPSLPQLASRLTASGSSDSMPGSEGLSRSRSC
jgi:Tol biopolymer transport system component/DNA-binding winged helix-turn-helix (wHTH) protein